MYGTNIYAVHDSLVFSQYEKLKPPGQFSHGFSRIKWIWKCLKGIFQFFPIVLWKWDNLSTLSSYVWVVKCFNCSLSSLFLSVWMKVSSKTCFFLSVFKFVPIHQIWALDGEWVQDFFEVQGWLIMMALGSSFSPITEPGSSYLSLSHHKEIHYRFDKTRLKTRWDKFDGYSNKRNRKWSIRDFRPSVNTNL